MAVDEKLAERVRSILASQPGLTEEARFGGIQFLIGGNLCCRVRQDLMVRLAPDEWRDALHEPHVSTMDRGGKPLRGWVFVSVEGLTTQRALRRWVDAAVRVSAALPMKAATMKTNKR